MTNVYEKYGGFKSVSRVVMTFYEMALESDEIGDFFEDVDMARLMDHQTKFISSLMGGPASFSDERLKQVHAKLGISHKDLDVAVELLSEALAEHGVEEADVKAVVKEIEKRRSVIVTV